MDLSRLIAEIDAVSAEANSLVQNGLATTTNEVYRTSQGYFVRYVLLTAARHGWPEQWALYDPTVARWMVVVFAAFMARSNKASSIKIHLQAVRAFYMRRGLPNPCEHNYNLRQEIKGIARRGVGEPECRKLPITPDILRGFAAKVNVADSKQVAFMTAGVIAFCTFARKANVSVEHGDVVEQEKILRRCDITVNLVSWSLLVRFRHTKTIQFGERVLEIPVQGVKGSPIDPVAWWLLHLSMNPSHDNECHAMAYRRTVRSPNLTNLTHTVLVKATKDWLAALGLNPSLYAGHSYRRGGASTLFAA